MTDTTRTPAPRDTSGDAPRRDAEELFERYGHHLPETETQAQADALLLILFDILTIFADLGFEVGPGNKLHENSDFGMDDVVDYLIGEETAPETVAPPKPDSGKEQP